jgi:putative membrane protein
MLLLVAPNKHKMRIEVGYGLEGTLTDALSSVIISSAMVPRFKAKDFIGGIERGIDGIVSVLSGDTTDWQPKPRVRAEDPPSLANELFFVLVAIFVIWSLIRGARSTPSGRYVRRGGPIIFFPTGGSGARQGGVAVLAMAEAGSAAAFQAAADGQAAVALPEAGDELMIEFTKADYEAVSAAIREAEKRTSGQIACVLAHSSSGYAYVPILWASVLALAAPWPLIEFTQWSVQRIFALQLAVIILAGFLFSWMPLRLALAPRPIRRLRAHRAALEQFVVRRVTHTRNRSGILIFVSMAEHYARVIADEGIAQRCIKRNGKPPSIP